MGFWRKTFEDEHISGDFAEMARQIIDGLSDDFISKKVKNGLYNAADKIASNGELYQFRRDTESILERIGVDVLTGLHNRSHFEAQFKKTLHAVSRGQRVIVMMFDVDHFKDLNDQWGHPAGDQGLRQVGAAFLEHIRGGDDAARYGGDEFVVALNDVCGDYSKAEGEAQDVFKRIYQAVSGIQVLGFTGLGMSAGGVFVNPGGKFTIEQVISAADQKLYVAKEAGKGRLEFGVLE